MGRSFDEGDGEAGVPRAWLVEVLLQGLVREGSWA